MATPQFPPESPDNEDTPIHFRPKPKRAMASFDNLVALANHQERLREARKMVWRDKGEPAVELYDLWECAEHAGRGGLRAAALAFAIRASVNLVLALMRIKRAKKEYRFTIIRKAIFGEESFRFAAMLGSFSSIYKFLLNALPILLPTSKRPRPSPFVLPNTGTSTPFPLESALDEEDPLGDTESTGTPLATRRGRLSLSAQAHQVWIRKKTRRWQSVLAGSVAGGIAIMLEKKNNRLGVAQQMFVRGLQGSYNAISTKHGFRVPHGDVLVFAFCCGQIMYAFLMAPETLPSSYQSWINQAAHVPVEAVRMNKDLVREGFFNLTHVDNILKRTDVTPNNRAATLAMRVLGSATPPDFGRHVVPCHIVHPMIDSCLTVMPLRFLDVFKWMLPVYGALHFVPMVLFKRKLFMKNPKHMLLRAGWGTTRSSAFLGAFVLIFQTIFCFKHHLHTILTSQKANSPFRLPQPVVDMLISKLSFWPLGFCCAFSILVEESRRRGELAMYVLPKGLGSMWTAARGHGWVFGTGKWGEPILSAIGMGMVMSTYQNDPHHLSGLVRRIMYQFIGPN